MTQKDKLAILSQLERLYPDAVPALAFRNPFELLIATILSAQCTDRQVNAVTPALFAEYPTAMDIAQLEPASLEPYIHSCGFFRAKARNIVATCRILTEKHQGEVPRDIQVLQSLPGVGPKTANVVASNAFGIDAIAVDTHVFRVSNRLGLVYAKNVLQAEQQLQACIPKNKWSNAHHWLIYHGRQVCAARKPACEICALACWCQYYLNHSNQDHTGKALSRKNISKVKTVHAK